MISCILNMAETRNHVDESLFIKSGLIITSSTALIYICSPELNVPVGLMLKLKFKGCITHAHYTLHSAPCQSSDTWEDTELSAWKCIFKQ